MENTHKFSGRLNLQHNSESAVLIADVDGTIFTAGWEIIKAPFYNLQTSKILKKNSIPLILVTGRPYWNTFADCEILLHGLPFPDIVVLAAGTVILQRDASGKLKKDKEWEKMLDKTSLEKWNVKEIIDFANNYFSQRKIKVRIKSENKFIVRTTLINFSVKHLENILADFKNHWTDGVKILTTEKLLRKNSLEIFSGDIIIVPKQAGKETAVNYLLAGYIKDFPSNSKRLKVLIFGDASIDISMLQLKGNKFFSLSQYGVHLTPLAKKELLEKQKENKNLEITDSEGPQFILKVMKNFPFNNKSKSPEYFSPAQNSNARFFVRPFEKLLDLFFDKKLSPNDISFLGLTKVIEGIDLTDKENYFLKIKGFYVYMLGIFADLFDGVRARKTNTFAPNGQLVDVFCDRAKEFYQLIKRTKSMFVNKKTQEIGYQTLLTAISSILPSIARAQVEINGKVVNEHDSKGGSMLERTKNLFLSLFFYCLGNYKKSSVIDKTIYEKNMATFYHRSNGITDFFGPDFDKSNTGQFSLFQMKALERFLLLVDLLQEENEIIRQFLSVYPEFSDKFKSETEKYCKEFLSINTGKIRMQLQIADYHLSLKSYLP